MVDSSLLSTAPSNSLTSSDFTVLPDSGPLLFKFSLTESADSVADSSFAYSIATFLSSLDSGSLDSSGAGGGVASLFSISSSGT